MSYKASIVNQIDSFYLQSSNLMRQQKQLLLVTDEIQRVGGMFINNDKILHVNSLLRQVEDSSLFASNIEELVRLFRDSVEAECFFKENENYLGSKGQIGQWGRVKEVLIQAFTKILTGAMRNIYWKVEQKVVLGSREIDQGMLGLRNASTGVCAEIEGRKL
jgi:hypothetical protein